MCVCVLFFIWSLFSDVVLSAFSSLAIISQRERERERAGCFTLIAFLLPWVSVSCVRPRGAVGWSVIRDCDISRSYSLGFGLFIFTYHESLNY